MFCDSQRSRNTARCVLIEIETVNTKTKGGKKKRKLTLRGISCALSWTCTDMNSLDLAERRWALPVGLREEVFKLHITSVYLLSPPPPVLWPIVLQKTANWWLQIQKNLYCIYSETENSAAILLGHKQRATLLMKSYVYLQELHLCQWRLILLLSSSYRASIPVKPLIHLKHHFNSTFRSALISGT